MPAAPQGKRTIKEVRRARWERQRAEAIKREQIASCYRAYKPPQCETR